MEVSLNEAGFGKCQKWPLMFVGEQHEWQIAASADFRLQLVQGRIV